MKRQMEVDARYKGLSGKASVCIWNKGDPFPDMGASCGIDTETELITDECPVPKLVVLGVFNPKDSTTYITYHEDAIEFFRWLCSTDTQQRYFNLGYDEQVLAKATPENYLIQPLQDGYVRDMQIRIHLNCLANEGYIPGGLYSLAGCTKTLMNIELDKGEELGDGAPRLTFRQGEEITDDQMYYLAHDCMSTWALGEVVPEQSTEITHTRGMVALANMTTNGFPVDMRVFDALEKMLLEARQEARQRLLSFGFPDPDRDAVRDFLLERENLNRQYKALLSVAHLESGLEESEEEDSNGRTYTVCAVPKKVTIRTAIAFISNYVTAECTIAEIAEAVKAVVEVGIPMKKAVKEIYDHLVDLYGLGAFDQSKRAIIMPALFGRFLEEFNTTGNFDNSMKYAAEYMDMHPEWLATEPPIGPKKFFQDHVSRVLAQNPGLTLTTTEKSGDIKLAKSDHWRLEDAGVTDKFLDAYVDFVHYNKFLSTYMNRDNIKPDGAMHGRYTNILRTGRTSQSPNL